MKRTPLDVRIFMWAVRQPARRRRLALRCLVWALDAYLRWRAP